MARSAHAGGLTPAGAPPSALGAGARALNDLGLAAWFGASLSRAGDAAGARDRRLQAAAAAVHLVGAAYLTLDNRRRIASQRGVAAAAAAKALTTALALAATAGPGARSARATTAFTGATLALNALLGEQQRPAAVARGVGGRLLGLVGR